MDQHVQQRQPQHELFPQKLWNHVHLQKFKSDSIPSCWKYISALSLAQSLKLSNNSGTAGGKRDQLPNDYAAGLAGHLSPCGQAKTYLFAFPAFYDFAKLLPPAFEATKVLF